MSSNAQDVSAPVAAAAVPPQPAGRAAGLLLFVGLTLVWGCNWPMMKIVLAEVPVLWFRAICVLAGAVGLLSLAAVSGNRLLPRLGEVPKMALTAGFGIVGWHLFTGYGLTLMPGGRASIIANTMPVWAAIFASFLLAERMTGLKFIGLILGLAGLGVLIGPDLIDVKEAPYGAMLMIGAAMSWAMGTVLFKRGNWSTGVAATTGWLLAIGSVPIVTAAVSLEAPPDVAAISAKAWAAIAFVCLLPMIFGQWAFYRIVNQFPAVVAAIGTMMVPVIGVISSALVNGEPISERDLAALALVSASLVAVLILPALWRR